MADEVVADFTVTQNFLETGKWVGGAILKAIDESRNLVTEKIYANKLEPEGPYEVQVRFIQPVREKRS
jgi:hypothetical protein